MSEDEMTVDQMTRYGMSAIKMYVRFLQAK